MNDAPSAPDTTPVIQLADVEFTWPGASQPTLAIPSFKLARGQKLLLVGLSGSGKTTLLNLIAGVTVPDRGRVAVLGQDLASLRQAARDRFRAEHIGIVFQMFNLLPYASVLDNVLLPLHFAPARRQRVAARGREQDEAARLISALALGPELHHKPAASLSIGQQQRVAAARALIGAPELIIADEPTSALDRDSQRRFLDLLFEQVDAAQASLVLVSHDERLGDRFDETRDISELQQAGASP